MIDDSREEHRMFIRLNDSNPALARSIVNESIPGIGRKEGILVRKTHEDSYTNTLYVVLEYYGMIPLSRIKPRVRFKRSVYDGLSSSSPIIFLPDSFINFAELKRSDERPKKEIDEQGLQRFFCDGPIIQKLADDPALELVSQSDAFLMQPPVKTKSKIIGKESGKSGIPVSDFLEALNNPAKAEKIFKDYKLGHEFAKDIRQALEPFDRLEFKYGVYSRYERRDCIFNGDKKLESSGYRTTFDPSTVLGWVKRVDSLHQLQLLCHERGTRWEHKIDLDNLDKAVQTQISEHIKSLRLDYLIPRALSKSQTALSLLADWKESQLNLLNDLPGMGLRAEISQGVNKFNDVNERIRLRAAFSGDYKLLDDDIFERHLNLAKGEKSGLVYILNNAELILGEKPLTESIDGITFIKQPSCSREVLYSANDLRDRMPTGFDRCYCEQVDEGGYTIMSQKTGRCYTISIGHRKTGSIKEGKISSDLPQNYISIKYLGIGPDRFKQGDASKEVYREVKEIAAFLRASKVIS